MKTNLIFLFLSLSFATFGQNIFQKYYDIDSKDNAYAIEKTNDNGYIIAGMTKTTSWSNQVMLIKISNSGDTVWSKTYGSVKSEVAFDVQETSDNGFIVTGKYDEKEVYLLKTNSIGDIQWEKHYLVNSQAQGFDVLQTSDGNYFVTGYTNQSSTGNDVLLLRVDDMGDTLWSKSFGGALYDYGEDIIDIGNNEFIITGYTQSFGAGNYDVYLLKVDINGTLLWDKFYGGTKEDYSYSVIKTADNNLLIGGYTKSFGAGNEDAYMIKTNLQGDTLWTRTYGNTHKDIGKDVLEIEKDKYLIVGSSESYDKYSSDFYAVATDQNGNQLWYRTYGAQSDLVDNEAGQSVAISSNKGFAIAGAYTFSGGTLSDFYFIGADSNGCSPQNPNFSITGISKPGKFCEGTNVNITLNNYSSYSKIKWSNNDTLKSTIISQSGTYTILLTDVFGCQLNKDVVSLTKFPKPSVKITADGPLKYCPGTFTSLSLHATKGYEKYSWNNSSKDTLPDFLAKSIGEHKVLVTDTNNCKNNTSLTIELYKPYDGTQICVVTTDSLTNKNMIVWHREKDKNIKGYRIQKETNQTGNFVSIGYSPFDSLSIFIDNSSNPRQKSDRYRIRVIDNCDEESSFSDIHKTLHLTSNVSTVPNEVNLIWEHYEGITFQTYNIYRGISPSKMTFLGSTQNINNTFTDQNAPTSSALFYQVSAVMMDTCYPSIIRAQTTSGPFSQSYSNLKDYSVSRPDYLQVAPMSQILSFNQDTVKIDVYSNLAWSVNKDKDWIHLDVNESENFFKISSDINYLHQNREGIITVSANGLKDVEIIIVQKGIGNIDEESKKEFVNVFPNPSNSIFNIEFDLPEPENVSIEVYNQLGKKTNSIDQGMLLPGMHQISIEPEENGSYGIYFLHIQIGNQRFYKKILKL